MGQLKQVIKSGSRMINAENPIEVVNIGRPGDPTQILIYKGKIYIYNSAGQTLIDGGYVSARAIKAAAVTAEKLSLGAKKFIHNIVWTATDYNTCSWSAGVIKFADGTTDNTNSGNTGNITQKTYVYYNGTSTLQKTTSYTTAIGGNNIPLVIVELVADTNAKCIITPITITIGGTIDGDLIITGKVQSVDLKTYFDINNNKIAMNDGDNDRLLIGKIGSKYGVKISLPTYDASIDTNLDHFALWAMSDDSVNNVLIKEKTRGSISVSGSGGSEPITHDLGYVPFFAIYANNQWVFGWDFFGDYRAYATTTTLILINNNSSSRIFKYYIFYDQQI